MLRFLATLVALLVCGALLVRDRVALQRAVAERALLERKVILLDRENERMRQTLVREEKGKKESRNRDLRAEIERAVEEIRGLKFKTPVVYDVVTRQEIKDVVARKLAENYSEQEFAEMSAALARLGLLPEKFPLRAKLVALLGEQIAAFYDQHTHRLFMFEDATLESAQNRVILAHELTHALQDQHFGLLRLPLEIKDNDDRAVAASALVEGEATQVMSAYMLRNLSLRTLKDSVGSAFTQDARQIAAAPAYLRETLLFPYLRGQEFCGAISGGGEDYEALSRCYARLPGSTSEILHPERYHAGWTPQDIAWEDRTFEGAEPALSNVVGEEGMRLHLGLGQDAAAAEKLAAHWLGDRFLHFAPADALVWKSVWASAAAAEEFQQVERRLLMKRYSMKEWGAATPAGRGLLILQTGPGPETVVVIDAPSAALAGRLAKRFAAVAP